MSTQTLVKDPLVLVWNLDSLGIFSDSVPDPAGVDIGKAELD